MRQFVIFLYSILILGMMAQIGNASDTIPSALLQEMIAEATRGDAEAQVMLGMIYRDGMDGVPKDETTAIYWLQKANAQDDASAYILLDNITRNASQIPSDISTHTNNIGMEFVLIPAGSFIMGTEEYIRPGGNKSLDLTGGERPRHNVTISKSFYLGKYEVTQAQWEAVMENNPSEYKDPNHPVERVSWDDAQEFIKRLNRKEGHTRYRLPTEAEWEFASRGGTNTQYFFGDISGPRDGAVDGSDLTVRRSGGSLQLLLLMDKHAWFNDNSGGEKNSSGVYIGGKAQPVGQKKPNQYGLYDIYGNVSEWVHDWYGETYYADSPGTDPKGPANGTHRVFRGGSWPFLAENCGSGGRNHGSPDGRGGGMGFRLALSPE